jgi:hypothetical protein
MQRDVSNLWKSQQVTQSIQMHPARGRPGVTRMGWLSGPTAFPETKW